MATTELSDHFYRNKRAALVSSVVVAGTVLLTPQLSHNASVYGLTFASLSSTIIIGIALAIAAYLNCSYFLQYLTEVPAWKLNAESNIVQVERLQKTVDNIVESFDSFQQMLSSQKFEYERAANRLQTWYDFTESVEAPDFVQTRFWSAESKDRNDFYQRVKSDLETGLRRVGRLNIEQFISKSNLVRRIADDGAKLASDEMIKLTRQFYAQRKAAHAKLGVDMSNVAKLVEEQNNAMSTRLVHFQTEMEKLQTKLGAWTKPMNIRLRFQYLYLPLFVFAFAAGAAIGYLSSGFYNLLSN